MTEFSTTRAQLAAAKEVGGMPFVLFQYYLTCADEQGRILAPLKQVAADLGMTKPAVCNLRARLKSANWIDFNGDEIFIKKSFTRCEQDSQDVNGLRVKTFTRCENHSHLVNDSSTRCESYSQDVNENDQNGANRSQDVNENGAHIRNIKSHHQEELSIKAAEGSYAPAREPSAAAVFLTDTEKKMTRVEFIQALKAEFSHIPDVEKEIGKCVAWHKRERKKPPNRLQVKKWLAEEYEDFDIETPTDWRKAIEECPRCDRRGMIQTEKGMVKCNHEKL